MEKKKLNQMAIAFIIFSIVCLISAFVFNISNKTVFSENLPPEGGILGPFTVNADNSVYQIKVNQHQRTNQWSFVSGEVLNDKKEYLFGFGKELWKESGRDSDGPWTEAKTDYDMKITLQKGNYFLGFENETSTPKGSGGNITIRVEQKRGSALFFFLAGIIGIIIGVVINEIANQTITTIISTMSEGD